MNKTILKTVKTLVPLKCINFCSENISMQIN